MYTHTYIYIVFNFSTSYSADVFFLHSELSNNSIKFNSCYWTT